MGRVMTAVLVVLLAAGVVVAGGVGGGPGEGGQSAAASEGAAAVDGEAVESERVSVGSDGSDVDVGVSLGWGTIAVDADGDGGGAGRVTHDAIDDGVADAGRAGACAVGFDAEGSPLDFAFDAGNHSFGLAWSAAASSGPDGSVDASEVLGECSSSGG